MKKLAAAAGIALLVSSAPALAGGIAPVMSEPVIVTETSSSAGGILVPIMALIMFAAALSN
ncbi:MAG: hypothetical protein AAGA70_00790 [Pseudomonadota bacterium]